MAFLGSILAFQLLFQHALIQSRAFDSYLAWTARMTEPALSMAGYSVRREHATLAVSTGEPTAPKSAQVVVAPGCDGVQAMFLYLAAVVLMPGSWRSKAIGLLGGISALVVLNLARIATLTIVQVHRPEAFDTLHLFVWPTAFLLATVGLFWVWVQRFVIDAPVSNDEG